MAADFERQPRVLPAVEDLIQLEVAAPGVGADDGARNARQPAPEILGDFIARAGALIAGHELHLHAAAVGLAEAAEAAAAATVGDDGRRFGHVLLHQVLEPVHHRLGDLHLRADR